MKKISLRKNVWNSDEEYFLEFPEEWDVHVYGGRTDPSLSEDEIESKLDNPISCQPLSTLALGKQSAVILIDDITRPTPTGQLLPKVISRLISSGIQAKNITILVATGTHQQSIQENKVYKIGAGDLGGVQVFVHDSHNDCEFLGNTKNGTPIFINRKLIENDLKICIGSIYPHPIAGFSGGSKLAVVGAGGYQTIRFLHDLRSGTSERTGNIDHPFRQEINEIARKIGIDFCINIVLNQQREICNIFSGDPEESFVKAVNFVKPNFSANIDKKAEIVISDIYPFDMDFQFGFDRGLWPFEFTKKAASNILLASCLNGIGKHELFPVTNPLKSRIARRLANLKVQDLFQIGTRIRSIKKILWRRKLKVVVVSPNIQEAELLKVLPNGQIASDWQSALNQLKKEYAHKPTVRVAIYKTSPLFLPRIED